MANNLALPMMHILHIILAPKLDAGLLFSSHLHFPKYPTFSNILLGSILRGVPWGRGTPFAAHRVGIQSLKNIIK